MVQTESINNDTYNAFSEYLNWLLEWLETEKAKDSFKAIISDILSVYQESWAVWVIEKMETSRKHAAYLLRLKKWMSRKILAILSTNETKQSLQQRVDDIKKRVLGIDANTWVTKIKLDLSLSPEDRKHLRDLKKWEKKWTSSNFPVCGKITRVM